MGLINYILIFEAILLLFLAFYVWLRNPKQAINISFFVMVFGSAIWVFSNATDYVYEKLFLTQFTYIGAILIASGFYYFSYYFPYRRSSMNMILSWFVNIISVFLIASLFINNLFYSNINYNDVNSKVFAGPTFHIFNIFFIVVWILGIINLILKYKIADGIHHWQIKNTFFALSISLVAGTTTNLILPWIFDVWTFGWVGPMFSIVFFGFLSYILFKK